MRNEEKLIMLRAQLFTAMQQLEGDDLTAFWDLIDDVSAFRRLYTDVPVDPDSWPGQVAQASERWARRLSEVTPEQWRNAVLSKAASVGEPQRVTPSERALARAKRWWDRFAYRPGD